MMKFYQLVLPPLMVVIVATPACVLGAVLPRATSSAITANQTMDFEVFLPLRDTAGLGSLLEAQQTKGSPQYHQWLTPAQFSARFGPTQTTIDRAITALQALGLPVTAIHARSLHVVASAEQVAKAFNTSLQTVETVDGEQHIVAPVKLHLSAALAATGAVIPAFAPVPKHSVHSQRIAGASLNIGTAGIVPNNRQSSVGPYFYNDLKQAYDYPSYEAVLPSGKPLNGTGVNIAVLMDSDVVDADVAAMFENEHYTKTTGLRAPTPHHVYVDGGQMVYQGDFAEAEIDVELSQGGAPGAAVTIYSVPDLSDQHILDGYVKIVDDNTADIVSSSFGVCELDYTAAYNGGVDYTGVFRVYDEEFQQGNAQGMTFTASSGDSGAKGCPQASYFYGATNTHFILGVESPASSPHVTAVGGGNLFTTPPPVPQTIPPTLDSDYLHEDARGDKEVSYDPNGEGSLIKGGWWAAGGGKSVIFSAPAYQAGVSTQSPTRTIPDVGMLVGGCPGEFAVQPCHPNDSSAAILIEGSFFGYIGTSVASPEFASAIAIYVEAQGGRVGNVNPFLYQQSVVQNQFGGPLANPVVQYFHKNIRGFDGYYSEKDPTSFDYTYLVGNGTPDVRKLFGLTQYPPAGIPRTPSNP